MQMISHFKLIMGSFFPCFTSRAMAGCFLACSLITAAAYAWMVFGSSTLSPFTVMRVSQRRGEDDDQGSHSQFTILIMTYDARLLNLKLSVEHYSWCPSVKEILVVWNKGTPPPKRSDLNSVVPLRIRVEEHNSMNNRFKMDPLIQTRGVLELDDDLIMSCDDIERGFRVWQQHRDRIVGFYPRYANPRELKYRLEDYAYKHGGYNLILTNAAFIDTKLAFERYWSDEAKSGREVVDKLFNCDDLLLNFLYANASSSPTVEYVKPSWVFSTERFSKVGISWSRDHLQIRSKCLSMFTKMFGGLGDRKSEFESQ